MNSHIETAAEEGLQFINDHPGLTYIFHVYASMGSIGPLSMDAEAADENAASLKGIFEKHKLSGLELVECLTKTLTGAVEMDRGYVIVNDDDQIYDCDNGKCQIVKLDFQA